MGLDYVSDYELESVCKDAPFVAPSRVNYKHYKNWFYVISVVNDIYIFCMSLYSCICKPKIRPKFADKSRLVI